MQEVLLLGEKDLMQRTVCFDQTFQMKRIWKSMENAPTQTGMDTTIFFLLRSREFLILRWAM